MVDTGRRWGKSTIGLVAAVAGHGPIDPATNRPLFRGALHGAHIWWVVPDMPLTGRDRWRDLKKALKGCWTYKNENEHRIELPGGGSIEIRSADDPDSLRGPSLDGVVIDEAALIDETAWTEALRPALSDYQGWAMFFSTPKGKGNWFYTLFLRGADDAELAHSHYDIEKHGDPRRAGWESWRRPSTENPQLTDEDLDDALADLGSLKFSQEYLAEFVVAGGHVFKRLWFRYYDQDAAGFVLDGDKPKRVRVDQLRKRAMVDLATTLKTTGDYTVITTYGVTVENEIVVLEVERRRMEGPDIVPALQAAYRKWRHAKIGIEKAGYQLSTVQAARRTGLPIRAIDAEKDKLARAEFLAARMEAGGVFFPRVAPWLADLEAELEAFDGAEGSEHDDQVDTLAYAAIDVAGGSDRRMRSS